MNTTHLISSYGYWALFGLVAAESLGVPLPGETALIVAGTYAGTTHNLNPWLIFTIASAAAIIGDNIGYWIGDKGGYPLARRYGPKVRLDERKLKTARYLFDRHGAKVVFFGRFVSILRTYAAFLAGTSKMRWRLFLPANAAGGIVWAGVYTLASYLAGHALERASATITWVLAGAAVVAIVVGFLVLRRQGRRLAARAEAAYPGPLKLARGPAIAATARKLVRHPAFLRPSLPACDSRTSGTPTWRSAMTRRGPACSLRKCWIRPCNGWRNWPATGGRLSSRSELAA